MRRGGPLQRRTRLRPMSAKRRSRVVERAECRSRVVERAECRAVVYERCGGLCEACPRLHDGPIRRVTEVHEPLTSGRGGNPYDPDQAIGLCAPCHHWIHTHPDDAAVLGLLRHSWEAR